MSANTKQLAAALKISVFERNLTWWVLACIIVGISLGKLSPVFFQSAASIQVAEVNLIKIGKLE